MNLFLPLALAALVDLMTPGAYVEQHEVRLTHLRRCLSVRCTALVYTVNYVERSCLVPVRASVLHRGAVIPIRIEETGAPGEAGYRWSLSTTRLFRGRASVVIEIGDICHDKS